MTAKQTSSYDNESMHKRGTAGNGVSYMVSAKELYNEDTSQTAVKPVWRRGQIPPP
jgi:hypothetical protein